MANEDRRRGSCLCGAVQVTASMGAVDVGACHCDKCRKWSGGPFLELECGADVDFDGAENISVYQSSRWAERGFCKICGSHLFMRAKADNSYGIPVGLFKNVAGIIFERQVFIDKKPAYYRFANDTKNISSEYIYQHYPQGKEDSY